MRIVGRIQRATVAHLVDEQLANLELPVVEILGAGKHRISAAPRLTIVVERKGEAVRLGYGMPLVLEPRYA